MKLILNKDEINPNPSKVGQAVYDILSKPQAPQEVGDTIDAMTPKYYEELSACIVENQKKLVKPFYIVVLRKKEPWAMNVLRQWFVARQSRPRPYVMRNDYPNHDHDVWKIGEGDRTELCWTLPTEQDSRSIMKNRHLYDASLVDWISKFNKKELT